MVSWLLDTKVVFELGRERRHPNVMAWAARCGERELYISVLTLGEYDKGLHKLAAEAAGRGRIETGLRAIEVRFEGRILSVSDSIVRRRGRISGAALGATGMSLPVVDTLLAATAIEHGLVLATRNVKDVRDTGARVFDPWQDDPSASI